MTKSTNELKPLTSKEAADIIGELANSVDEHCTTLAQGAKDVARYSDFRNNSQTTPKIASGIGKGGAAVRELGEKIQEQLDNIDNPRLANQIAVTACKEGGYLGK